jgi:hypothetical protein
MQVGKSWHPSTHPRGPNQQDHGSTNVRILNNLHVRQKQNEKKALDQVKKKKKIKMGCTSSPSATNATS